jgi:ribonuclease-3 family protein
MLFAKVFGADCTQEERLRQAKEIPLRNLAHLGDAVYELFEREREVIASVTVRKLHQRVVSRVNSKEQARLLEVLKPSLSEDELDIVRRARNLKPGGFRRNVEQTVLRQATAFEALIGYRFLTDEMRLQELLALTDEERDN